MNKSIEPGFGLVVTQTEYKRVLAVTIFLVIGFIIQLLNFYFNQGIYLSNYGDAFLKAVFSFCLIITFEITMLLIIKSYLNKKKTLSKRFILGYTYFEALFPSIYIYSSCSWVSNSVHLDSPVFILYYIFILLSTLHLERSYSLLTGFVSGIGYMIVVYSVINDPDIESLTEHNYLFLYYSKGIGLIASGILAGVITALIKKQFERNIEVTEEKSKMQRIFGQQVSREVVQKLIDENAHNDIVTEEVEASIMFMDIRNFSSYTENKNPKEIIEFQNTILNPLIQIIDSHNGIINQILGDGFMATFGTPIENKNHCQNAFNAGIEILEKMKDLKKKGVLEKSDIGIGLAVGTVVTGNIGNNLRKQFSVAGRTVILASRLEQLNKQYDSNFLISANVMNAISSEIEGSHLGKINVKGFEEKIDVYKIR